jgi:hypothetical protein
MATHAGQLSPPVRVIAARTVGYVLAALALWDGAGLVLGGASAVRTPTWAVLRAFPGPEVMGLIFIATAIVLLFCLAVPGELLAWVLAGGMCLYLTIAGFQVAAWVLVGDVVWTAPSKNVAIAVFWLLVLRARPITPTSEASRPGRR